MTKYLLKILGFPTSEPKREDDFLDFINGKSSEKIQIIRQVLREANAEQREIMRKYEKIIESTAK